MQVFWMVNRFFAKVLLGAAVLLWLSVRYSGNTTWSSLAFQWAACYTTSFAVFLVNEAYVYPLFFSPLRHLPKVDSGYDMRLVLEGPRGKTPLKWFKKYPDADLILSQGKIGQQVLFPVSPEALKDVLFTHAYDFEKLWGLRAYLARLTGWGLIAAEGPAHKAQRKALHPAFNIKHIRALYPIMWSKAELFLDRMYKESQKAGSIDMNNWGSRYALDIIGEAALSKGFGALEMDEYHPVARSFAKSLEPEPYLVMFLGLLLACPPSLVYRLPLKANKVLSREDKFIDQMAADVLRYAKSDEKASKNNIMSKILENGGLTDRQMIDEIRTTIAAGHETSASSMTWAVHLLTLPENKHYQQLLRDEVRNAIPSYNSSEMWGDFNQSETTLQSAIETQPYLNGICEEVLRLFPPVPATMREAVRKTSIMGTIVPKGTIVVPMPYAINRNPKYWGEDADEMKPERWIDILPDGSKRANKHGGVVSNFCEITFLHGPRACIGRDFARAELKCALAAIFGRFEVSRLPGDDGKVKVKGAVTTKPQGGLHVSFKAIP